MQTSTNAFAPYVDGIGLKIGVLPGVALIGTTPTAIGGTIISLTANATNFVFLNLGTGQVQANTSGFAGQYAIATVTTGTNSVLTLTDSRCDVVTGYPTVTTNFQSAQNQTATVCYSNSDAVPHLVLFSITFTPTATAGGQSFSATTNWTDRQSAARNQAFSGSYDATTWLGQTGILDVGAGQTITFTLSGAPGFGLTVNVFSMAAIVA